MRAQSSRFEDYWDVSTGEPQSISAEQARVLSFENKMSRWWSVPDGNSVRIVDREFKSRPEEAAFRVSKAKPDLSFYQYFADEASERADWFGGAVNNARLLLNQPPNRTTFELLRTFFLTRLRQEERAYLPAVVDEALALPAPKMTRKDALRANNTVWFHVETRRREPQDELLQRIEEVCQTYPEAMFFNTLGVVRFRRQEYEQAIEACERAVSLGPASPIDFAILAMSHAKLGQTESANKYRDQFEAAVARVSDKSDEETLRYVSEMKKAFAKD